MSEQNEKLTLQAAMMKHGVLDGYRNVQNIESAMKDYAAQQVEHATAELRKENIRLRENMAKITLAFDLAKSQLAEAQRQRDESELRNENLHLAISRKDQSIDDLNNNYKIIERQRDEVVNKHVDLSRLINILTPGMAEQFHRHDYKSMWDIWELLLSRLSSGETKLEAKCPICRKGDWVIVTNGNGEKSNRCLECSAESLTDKPE